MKFSMKKTCNTCRANLGDQGCLFSVNTEKVSDQERRPLEPCKKPVTNVDMSQLCSNGNGFDDELNAWRLKFG